MRRTLLLFVLFSTLTFTSAAWGSGADVIRDCTDNGRIDQNHGPQDYSEALANLPSDVDEYTDCRQIISAARRNPPNTGGGGSGGGGGGGGGSFNDLGGGGSGSNASGKAVKPVAAAKAKPVAQGPPITPPPSTLGQRPLGHGVPTPLIVTLAVLALAALAWLAAGARGLKPPVPLARAVERVFPRRA